MKFFGTAASAALIFLGSAALAAESAPVKAKATTATPTPVATPTPTATPTPAPPAQAAPVLGSPESVLTAAPPPVNASFLDLYPQLKSYLYQEPPSGLFVGLGLTPVGVLKNSFMFTGNFFELHWIKDRYDIEILDAAYGVTESQASEFQSTHFTFRAAPKYRFFGILSAGPLIGYELVSFPNVGARLFRSPKIQPSSEPYSARGFIFGAMLSETVSYKKDYLIKINELAYQETYSTSPPAGGWSYIYDDSNLQLDQSKISASTVFMLEISFLY